MKITIGGETFDFDAELRPMSEALAIEKEWGRRYAEWEEELRAGSAEAMAVLAWLVLRREGREVSLADITEGRTDFDYIEMLRSINAGRAEQEPDPTGGAEPRTDPDGTDTTPPATKDSSPSTWASGRGKSAG